MCYGALPMSERCTSKHSLNCIRASTGSQRSSIAAAETWSHGRKPYRGSRWYCLKVKFAVTDSIATDTNAFQWLSDSSLVLLLLFIHLQFVNKLVCVCVCNVYIRLYNNNIYSAVHSPFSSYTNCSSRGGRGGGKLTTLFSVKLITYVLVTCWCRANASKLWL